MALTYQDAGVDVTAGYEAVRRMKQHAESTFNEHVMSTLGSFGGLYEYGENVLVSGTDGVGTKLKLAFALDRHDTVGIDCVAMCVNDVVCHGASPLFFLDYIATGRLIPSVAASIVSGVAEGCRQAGCALIGGETAEMPGFYPEGEYDLAGFCVGSVSKAALLSSNRAAAGDALLALASSGIHSNGFSLVRKLISMERAALEVRQPELGTSLGEALLTPTRIYVKPVLSLIRQMEVHSIAHITGGGFYENIPRSIPKGCSVRVERRAVRVLPVFELLRSLGGLDERDMFGTFNMGVGMTITLPPTTIEKAISLLRAEGVEAYPIGEVVAGGEGVSFC